MRKLTLLFFVVFLSISASLFSQSPTDTRSNLYYSYIMGDSMHTNTFLLYRNYSGDTLIDKHVFKKFIWEKFTNSDTILSVTRNFEYFDEGKEYILLDSVLNVIHHIKFPPGQEKSTIFGEESMLEIEEFDEFGFPDSCFSYSIIGKDKLIIFDQENRVPIIFRDSTVVLMYMNTNIYAEISEKFKEDVPDLSNVDFGFTSIGDKMQVVISFDMESYNPGDLSAVTPNNFLSLLSGKSEVPMRIYEYEYIRDEIINDSEKAVISVKYIDPSRETLDLEEEKWDKDRSKRNEYFNVKGKPILYFDFEEQAGPIFMKTSSMRNVLGIDSYVFSFHFPYNYGLRSDIYSVFPVAIHYAAGEAAKITYLKLGEKEYGEWVDLTSDLTPSEVTDVEVIDAENIEVTFSLQEECTVKLSLSREIASFKGAKKEDSMDVLEETFSRGKHVVKCKLDKPLIKGMEYELSFFYSRDRFRGFGGLIFTADF